MHSVAEGMRWRMGDRQKRYSYREFVRILKKNGYRLVRTNGDHYVYKRKGKAKTIVINYHPNQMVMQRLIKQNNLEV